MFEAFFEHVLVPELQSGDIVVMDSLSSHKRQRVRKLVQATGAELRYLPPYSPDLNPIEHVFSKTKQLLRKPARIAQDALWRSMQTVLGAVTPSDATNCLQHAGIPLHVD